MPALDLRPFLEALIEGGTPLTADDAHRIAAHVAAGEAEPHQLAALLALLAARGESSDVVFGFARAMREVMVSVPREAGAPPLLDIVGTGGDGHNSVNISTAAAIVAAAAGVPVAKHGSVSVSSRSGAADVLRELGVPMLLPGAIGACVASAGIAFMFAPLFHPAMRHVVPLRKALRVRTVFNILGPLLNPAGASRLVLGVFHPRLLRVYADAVALLGVERALVVHCCGLDELAPVGPAQVVEVRAGHPPVEATWDPADWGVPRCAIADLAGGEPAENARIIRRLLDGDLGERPAVAHAVALNAGAALYVYGAAATPAEGFAAAMEVLRAGRAGERLTHWSGVARELEAAADGEEGKAAAAPAQA
jgi:anthranilate phosphoribosyltransferase